MQQLRALRGERERGQHVRGTAANSDRERAGSAREARTAGLSGRPDGITVSTGAALSAVLACALVVGLTAATAVVGLNSPIIDRPAVFVTLRVVACVGMVIVALVALARDSSARLVALMSAIAFSLALTGLTAANVPGLFELGRISIPVSIVLIGYFCLAYPEGRIGDPAASRLLALAAAGFAVLVAANLLLTSVAPVAGPFVRCVDTACPANPINVLDVHGTGRALSTALALWTTLTLAAITVLVARRMRNATALGRRGLAPPLIWTALTALGYGFFMTLRAVDPHARLLVPAAIALAAIIAALPLAIALGMARGRVLAMHGLERMVAALGDHPGLVDLERAMSRAFRDPTLRLLFWQPSAQHYVDLEGHEVDSRATAAGRHITQFSRNGVNIAAVAHDSALSDEREVLDAAGSAVVLTLENAQLSAELGASIAELDASRKRLASTADEERRRIEQDLHDGAQQGLIALRIRLGLLEDLAADDPWSVAPLLADAGKQIDATINQIRSLAQGIYPSTLRDLGLARALAAVARDLPITVALHAGVQRRFPPEIEAAVYFCCMEALQNVAKHCGAGARVNLTVSAGSDGLKFIVADDGGGFDPALASHSHGITGMRDRVEAIGGTLTIRSSLRRGTTVVGTVPAAVL